MGEDPSGPTDSDRPGCWCTDAKHGAVGTLVTTTRHNTGRRWLARWVDTGGQERSKSFDRRRDADDHVKQVTADLMTGAYVDTKRSATIFGTVAEEWLAAKTPRLKPSTAGGYRSLLDHTLLPRWRGVKLADITHSDVQQWVTWMTTSKDARQTRTDDQERNAKRKPLSARRAVQAHGILKQVLAFAIRTKRLAANPCDDIELPRVVHRRETALTHQQVHALADAAGDAGPIVLTLSYSGLRFGELAALRVADIDLTRRRILVTKAIAQVTGAGLNEDTTKTNATRAVPILTDALADALADAVADRGGSDYLFPAPDGGPMRNSYFRWRFDSACLAAGLEGISPKTLRHTAGSLALASGASVVTVQRLLGHKDATTTLRVYSHMMPDDFDNLAAAMNAASNSATGAESPLD
ncbi:MAG: tyrosine-type recombinase/integrase [Candidatus Nanopelagicales bacterium]